MTRNFQGYSTHGNSDLVGLGVSAISRVDDCYAQNPTALADYEAALDAGRLATVKGIRLSLDERVFVKCRGDRELRGRLHANGPGRQHSG